MNNVVFGRPEAAVHFVVQGPYCLLPLPKVSPLLHEIPLPPEASLQPVVFPAAESITPATGNTCRYRRGQGSVRAAVSPHNPPVPSSKAEKKEDQYKGKSHCLLSYSRHILLLYSRSIIVGPSRYRIVVPLSSRPIKK